MGVRGLVINILRRCARGFGSAWGSFVWGRGAKVARWWAWIWPGDVIVY